MTSSVDFAFPGTPYQVQQVFMAKAYQAMSEGELCILESPTGTGKSLSLICSCLAWLRDCREHALHQAILSDNADARDEDLPDWVRSTAIASAMAEAASRIETWKQERAQSLAYLSRFGDIESNPVHFSAPKRGSPGSEVHKECDSDSDLLADEDSNKLRRSPQKNPPERRLTIFICSRTHSQISQLIKEFKKCSLAREFNIVPLGSRSILCVNPSISKTSPVAEINDKCRRLVDSHKCSHKKNPTELGNLTTAKLMDLEEVVAIAHAGTGGCPYFETRKAAQTADIVLVPYAYVIEERTRNSLGLDLQGNIVVFDEAHNLLESMNSSRSLNVNISDIESVVLNIGAYLLTYSTRLAPRNLVLVKQVQYAANRFLGFMRRVESGIFTVGDFLSESKCDQLNMPSIAVYLNSGDFCRKIRGFASKQGDVNPSGIYTLAAFISKLHEAEPADRIALMIHCEKRLLVFASIDAESQLAHIVKEARAVLLVGGTMEPIDEFNIVAKISKSPFKFIQCNNPVGSDRIFARVIQGISATKRAVFTKERRDSVTCTQTVSSVLMAVIRCMERGGIIVFVSSFEFLKTLSHGIEEICGQNGLAVAFDGPGKSSMQLIKEHSSRIQRDGRSVLVSVVGGSLSEGIDFKDNLCRSVILVGMPYGNITDPLLKERMNYYDREHANDPLYMTGKMYYENKCLKAVSQCIGRAIRHSKDWSSVFLVDARYARKDILEKLPMWIRDEIRICDDVDEAFLGASQFFNSDHVASV